MPCALSRDLFQVSSSIPSGFWLVEEVVAVGELGITLGAEAWGVLTGAAGEDTDFPDDSEVDAVESVLVGSGAGASLVT